jgi:hypothetical protein
MAVRTKHRERSHHHGNEVDSWCVCWCCGAFNCFVQELCESNTRGAVRAMPCLAMPCLAMPCHALPCLAMPCHALPCHALPCLAMPCHAMPCLALPCLALPLVFTRSLFMHVLNFGIVVLHGLWLILAYENVVCCVGISHAGQEMKI